MLVEEHQTLSANYKRKHDENEIKLKEVLRVFKNLSKKFISLVIYKSWNVVRERVLKERIKENEKLLKE